MHRSPSSRNSLARSWAGRLAGAGLWLAVALHPSIAQNQGPPTVGVNIVSPLPLPVDVGSDPIAVEVNPSFTEPFQRALSFDRIDAGDLGRSFFEDVPEGKLAVLDHVSLRAELPIGQIPRAQVLCQGAGLPARFDIPMTFIGNFGGRAFYVATTPLRCYARGNGSVVGSIGRDVSTGDTGEIAFSFSAHLEDLPDAP